VEPLHLLPDPRQPERELLHDHERDDLRRQEDDQIGGIFALGDSLLWANFLKMTEQLKSSGYFFHGQS
jgi:hypothetical protein